MTFDPEHIPHFWINRLSFLIRKDLQARFRKAGFPITAEEWAVLLFLWQQDERSAGELAALSLRDPTTMTRMLDGMERKALITRKPDPNDRRRSRVCLTARARELRPELTLIARNLIARSLEGIAERDLDTTLRTLMRIHSNLDRKERSDV